jgi:hypothetical protein
LIEELLKRDVPKSPFSGSDHAIGGQQRTLGAIGVGEATRANYGAVLILDNPSFPSNDGRYHASLPDCRICVLKQKCCPNMPSRRIVRDVNEAARDVARALAKTEAFERSLCYRKRVEMHAHLKRILRLGRLRLRGPCGAQDEFTLAAIAQNLRRLSKLVARPPPVADACLA